MLRAPATALGRILGCLGAAVLGLLLVAWPAGPAGAHAALLSTTPANNEIAPTAPAEVGLTFGEAVGTDLGGVRVYDTAGDRVDTGAVTTTDDRHVVHAALRPGLPEGSYEVVWRVVSADSHPVSGTFVFSVGHPSPLPAGYAGRIRPNRSPGLALGLTRLLGFTGLLVSLGATVFCLLLWRDGARSRGFAALVAVTAATGALSAVAGVVLQGPYAAGLGIAGITDPTLLWRVMHTRYGQATAARAVIMLVAALLALVLPRLKGGTERRAPIVLGGLTALGVAAAGTDALAGHAGAAVWQPFSLIADGLHLVSTSVWVGGLVVIGFGLRRWWDEPTTASLLPGWSRLATLAVGTLLATGVFASWREVRSFSALAVTAYGGLLVTKVCLVGFMMLLALVGRSFVASHFGPRADRAALPDDDPGIDQLKRTTLVETLTAGLVLAVTAVLVQTAPAISAYAPPYTGTSKAGPYSVQVDVYPARKGLNGLHLYTLGPDGRTEDVAEVTGVLTRADGSRLAVHPAHKSLGHYEDLRVIIPSTGSFRLDLQVRVDDLTSYPTTQTITVH